MALRSMRIVEPSIFQSCAKAASGWMLILAGVVVRRWRFWEMQRRPILFVESHLDVLFWMLCLFKRTSQALTPSLCTGDFSKVVKFT